MPQGNDPGKPGSHRFRPDTFPGFKRLSSRSDGGDSPHPVRHRFRDVLVPPQCLGCGATVDADDVLCLRCWPTIRMIGRPFCETCGTPFDFDQAATVCATCARVKPPFERARSAVVYDAASRRLMLAFKHADRMEAAGLFIRWLLIVGESLFDAGDLIVPVPLHPKRLFRRRYNQAALLAGGVAEATGLACDLELIERLKPSPPPGKLSPRERRRAVSGAFRVPRDRRESVAGRRVIVVDDVMTTGATAWAVSRRLTEAGAAGVDILTVARALRE